MPIFQTKLPKLQLPAYNTSGFGTVRSDTSQTIRPQPNQSSYYTGSLAGPSTRPLGEVTADMLNQQHDPNGNPIRSAYTDYIADQAGYRAGAIPQGIPGTATNYTQANPPPVRPRLIDAPGGANVGGTPPVQANPWFATNPWNPNTQQKEPPPWMSGFPRYGRS